MKTRSVLAFINLFNFLIGIFTTGYVLNSSWSHLTAWESILYIYYVLLGFCGIALVCWVFVDERRLHFYAVEIQKLERRIVHLEQRINRIKTSTLDL